MKQLNNLWNPQELYARKTLLIPKKNVTTTKNVNLTEKVEKFCSVAKCEVEVANDFLRKYKNVDIALERYFQNQKKLKDLNSKAKYSNDVSDLDYNIDNVNFGDL